MRDEGFSKIIPETVKGLFKKLNIGMNDVDKLVFPCFFKAEHRAISKRLGAKPDQVIDSMHEVSGDTGAAHPLVMLVSALEASKPGDRILLAGFGQGCDALYFRVTEKIKSLMDYHMHRFRDQVLVEVRNSEPADLADPGLALIKRRILEKSNDLFGDPILRSIIFSQFSYIEQ